MKPRMLSAATLLMMTVTSSIRWSSSAVEHIVGDSIWSIPPSTDYYSNWSSNTSILVGDILVFRFDAGFYDVVQVSRMEYDDCKFENPFRNFLIGPAKVSLQEAGVFYFLCSIGNYCSLGQKLFVTVQPKS